MARLCVAESVETDSHASLYRDPSIPPNQQMASNHSAARDSLSQSPSFGSDKENDDRSGKIRESLSKSHLPTPTPDLTGTSHPNKRRRLSERDNNGNHEDSDSNSEDEGKKYWDPDQPLSERRAIRKNLRDLTKKLNDSRPEYLQPGSTGLTEIIEQADRLFENVKQTSEATLDSRLLVTTGDLTARKTTQLQLGDASQQIDLDEFVSKCRSFMRHGDERSSNQRTQDTSSTQHRRQNAADDQENEEDLAEADGDGLNWSWLGAQACAPNNIRPAVPCFLLGPLSVQKRARAPRVARAILQRTAQIIATRPEELKATDIERQENSNLTHLCRGIERRLEEVIHDATTDIELLLEQDKETEAKFKMKSHGICDDGGLNLFKFVINPESFGQTVENLFYVSFLIRDGDVGIGEDSNGMATLHNISKDQSRNDIEDNKRNTANQAIFTLDFETWKELVNIYNITESVIGNRSSLEDVTHVSAGGWYG